MSEPPPSIAASRFLSDRRYLPHRLDFRSRRILYVEADPQVVAGLAFLDGRTGFSKDERDYVIGIDDAIAGWPDERRPAPPPMIFHSAFCGSTLLARALDVPGQIVCLKEPQILIDLANWHAEAGATDDFRATLALILGQLARSGGSGQMLVKPSNWVNNIAGEILAQGSPRALFLTSGLREFLIAAFRGGSERIAFLARLVVHLARIEPGADALVRAATTGGTSTMRAARLCALALGLQQRLFDRVRGTRSVIGYRDLVGDPAGRVAAAAAELGLRSPAVASSASIDRAFASHAKDRDHAYDPAAADAVDREVHQRFRTEIEGAEAWAQEAALFSAELERAVPLVDRDEAVVADSSAQDRVR